MSEEKKEGLEKKCGKCGLELICVKIEKEWQGKKEVKLQWQTKSIRKAHFKFAGEKDGKTQYDCMTPEQVVQESMPRHDPDKTNIVVGDPPKEVDTTIKVTNPFQEAELIARWAGEKAYKIVMAGKTDYSKLSPQEKSGLGQKEGMYTRLLADTVIELMKHNGIKSEYAK